MDISKLEKRNPALDIIRIVAAFTVLSVHFFLHNGFYYETVQGIPMYIMTLMRTLFSVCVPLFMILTGYLMCNKTLSKKYYKGISKTLVVFVIATLACMLFKTFHDNEEFSLIKFIFNTFDFTGANYSWYIEMYIGLFLIAPFLNLAYNNLGSQRKKQVLVFTFAAIVILPSLFNIFNFESIAWWGNPTSSDTFQKIVPSWWTGVYPIAYYFVGCYFREYGMKIKTRTLLAVFFAAIVLFGSFNFYRSYGTTFKSGVYVYWYGFEPYVLSSFLFVLLTRIETDKLSIKTKFALWKLSDLALGIYLISFVFDKLVYDVLNRTITPMQERLPFYFITVPTVFILSAVASYIMNALAKGIIILFHKVVDYVKVQKETGSKQMWQDIFFIALMACGIVFAMWKAFYGFGGNDEAFYLTIPDRLSMGDAFITEEWHLSQLSGFLLVPFVSIYKLIVGSTEGIMLAARFNYIIFHAVVAFVIYSRFRNKGILSVVASFLFFIFTPYNIMALSYNTMGLDFVAITGVLMGTNYKNKTLPTVIAGLTFAAAVLCSPYLAAAYVLFGICVILHYILKKRNLKFVISEEIFGVKSFLKFTVGVVILAVIFLVFTLSRASISEFINVMPNLMTDPEHPQLSLDYRISLYFKSIFNFHDKFKIAVISYFVMLIAMIIDKKRKVHRSLYLVISAAISIFTLVLIVPNITSSSYNSVMFPMIFIGITSYILCNKKPRSLFISLFVLGIIHSIALEMTSNQYFYVISMALASSNIASYIFLAQLLKEMKENEDNFDYKVLLKYSALAMVVLTICVQGFLQLKSKAEHCFWDSSVELLTSEIPSGPAKGIMTTADNCNNYVEVYNDIVSYKNYDNGNILFLSEKTWTYLAVDNLSYGTLSAWITEGNEVSLRRLEEYYKINPEKVPNYIYILKNSKWESSVVDTISKEWGYNVNETYLSYKLDKIG
ncbi:MAG: acyltransferase family protein [Ruminococcus sp.]|nr:acyltransferase family protein [Ruminococcus sp.]